MSKVGLIYDSSAISRILQASEEGLHEFFSSAPHKAAKSALDRLPQPDGFRKGSPIGMKQQLKILWKRLAGEMPASPEALASDHYVLMSLWLEWAYHFLSFDDQIRSLIADYAATLKEGRKPRTDAQEDVQSVREIFQKLLDRSRAGELSRDVVEAFYTYGPFESDKEVELLILFCKSQEEIELERVYKQLPQKFQQAQEQISALEDVIKTKETERASESTALQQLIHDQILALAGDLELKVRVPLEELYRRIEDIDSNLSRFEEDLDREIARSREQTSNWEPEVADLQKQLGGIAHELDKHKELDQALCSRLDELEQVVKSQKAPEPTVLARSASESAIHFNNWRAEYQGQIQIKERDLCDIQTADNWPSVRETLKKYYAAAGLLSTEAEKLAGETTAGIQAGQVVMFSGGLARVVATACVNAISAERYVEVNVPLGLKGQPLLAHAMDRCQNLPGDSLGCLLIDGINRSAFDIVAGPLVQRLVEKRLDGAGENHLPFIVAVLSDGPGALPLSWHYGQLGPAFDTDAFRWRPRSSSGTRELVHSYIPQSLALAKETLPTSSAISAVLDLLEQLSKEVDVRVTPLIRHTISTAAQYLLAARADESEDEAELIDSVLFGWIVPFLPSHGNAHEALLGCLAKCQLEWGKDSRLAGLGKVSARKVTAGLGLDKL